MTSLNTNQTVNQAVSSFTFTNPIKLDRSNYTIWKSQILTSVRANGLEGLLDRIKRCPEQFLVQTSETSLSSQVISTESRPDLNSTESQENSAFTAWKRQDQLLLSWLMSSICVEILSLMVNSNSSHELWTNLEEQF